MWITEKFRLTKLLYYFILCYFAEEELIRHYNPVGWSYRRYQLHLFRVLKPLPIISVQDMLPKPSDTEDRVLKLKESSAPLLPLLSGPL